MSNFAFLPDSLSSLRDSAQEAERHIHADPRGACFHARFALESLVHWLYRHDASLRTPYDQSLGALLHEPTLQKLLPEAIFQKARIIQKSGNQAVHGRRPIRQYDAQQMVKELHHLLYWVAHTYYGHEAKVVWDDQLVPQPEAQTPSTQKELVALEAKLEEQNEERLAQQQLLDQQNEELQQLKQQLEEAKAANEAKTDTHDYSEAETREYLIDVELERAGWLLENEQDREYEVTGMRNKHGIGYADYVLWGDDGKPLAVIEAKRTTKDANAGRQQAKLYADCLEKMHGQRPVIFYTNGYDTWIWDDQFYPPRKVAGFYNKEALERIVLRRSTREPLDTAEINRAIVERPYQKRAIGSICSAYAGHQRKGLLVMATGTGKTRTAIALTDLLQRANWAKRVLFLADRISLVNQACNAFKQHLPDSSPVNLVTESDENGRVYVCTYPTMMGVIDKNDGIEARFGVGYFDLIIIDEAHRSVYQRYREIFNYFDSLLLGLTATPRDQVDKNTYELFDLEPGVPTDAYELQQAVDDEYLVPPKARQVDLKFPREGIDYDSLSDEEKEEWESLDWGDSVPPGAIPDKVNAEALNLWLFNKDTVDKVLQYLMENGHKVDGGDRLGKTIIFARNHKHAEFICERFDKHYPHYKGNFARVIDNYVNYPQSLIDDFSQKDKAPHIAISVDMLDTGIDVPEIVNLVFFKPVYSKIKFFQMIGRGTRLCKDLFGPGDDKQDFRIFDFCFNFDFFNENPDGIEGSGGASLSKRIFTSRVELLSEIQKNPELAGGSDLPEALTDQLHGEVKAMNRDNFIVRMHLEPVERYQKRENWKELTPEKRNELIQHVAGLPAELEPEEIESRHFDLLALRLQLAKAIDDTGAFEKGRIKMVDIAALLEDKASIPAVAEQMAYITAMQTTEFWQDITLQELEQLRLKLRRLVPLIDKKKRPVVYTNFQDEIMGANEDDSLVAVRMTGPQYEKKVQEFLLSHIDHIVIHKLRHNEPLTPQDLEVLESMLIEVGEQEGKYLLKNLLTRAEAPSLPYFVRQIVGMDRPAVMKYFAEFLADQSLTQNQIRFVEVIIDQLTSRGTISPEALYEPPFSHIHSGGPDELFAGKEKVIDAIFGTLKSIQPEIAQTG
jgi:type I restriction enzyme R subunit